MAKSYQHSDFSFENMKGKTMLGFFIGLFVGAFIGVVVMCLLSVAGQSDHNVEQNREGRNNIVKNENSTKSL